MKFLVTNFATIHTDEDRLTLIDAGDLASAANKLKSQFPDADIFLGNSRALVEDRITGDLYRINYIRER